MVIFKFELGKYVKQIGMQPILNMTHEVLRYFKITFLIPTSPTNILV